MFFDSALFIWFLFIVFAVFWGLVRFPVVRVVWLLLASYAFYASWNYQLLALILFSTCVDFVVGQAIHASEDQRRRKAWLFVSIAANLGLLAVFKYADFFLQSVEAVAQAAGSGTEIPLLKLVLPVGISFYTFQTMSYTIDVYRGGSKPVAELPGLRPLRRVLPAAGRRADRTWPATACPRCLPPRRPTLAGHAAAPGARG